MESGRPEPMTNWPSAGAAEAKEPRRILIRSCDVARYPIAGYRRGRSVARRRPSIGLALRRRLGFEPLEPRLAMAAQFVISEFMASNTAGIRDQDLHFSDWIEVQNIGDTAGNLQGYYLTDDRLRSGAMGFSQYAGRGGRLCSRVRFGKGPRSLRTGAAHQLFARNKTVVISRSSRQTARTSFTSTILYPPQLDNISYGVLDAG